MRNPAALIRWYIDMNTFTPLQTSSRIQRLSFVSFGQEDNKLPEAAEKLLAMEEQIEASVTETVQHIAPLITEEQLQKAREDGRVQGYNEGLAAAEAKSQDEAAKREEEIKSVLETIASRITLAAEEHASYIASRQDVMNKAVVAIAKKIANDALKAEPYATVEATLKECLALIIDEPKVTVTVPVGMSAGLKQRIDSLRPLLLEFNGELLVQEDADLKENDCRVAWKNGYGERDMARLWSDIETIIVKTRVS